MGMGRSSVSLISKKLCLVKVLVLFSLISRSFSKDHWSSFREAALYLEHNQ